MLILSKDGNSLAVKDIPLDHFRRVSNAINKNKKSLGLTQDVQPNLENYVTEKALFAMFSEIEIQENAIRKDPIQRSSELLKKVFDYADKNQN